MSPAVMLYRVGRNLNRAVRSCHSFGVGRVDLIECAGRLAYLKIPTEYDAIPAIAAAASLPRPLSLFCFHGRDRTGRFVEVWLSC